MENTFYSCRLEFYVKSNSSFSKASLICDIESPNFPVGSFHLLEQWIAEQSADKVTSLAEQERMGFEGTAHLRIFTSAPAAWFSMSPRLVRALGNIKLAIRFAYYAVPPNGDAIAAETNDVNRGGH